MVDETQSTLFEERFLGRYAGTIMSDPTTALVELVANAWDAYATTVEIQWPEKQTNSVFYIQDNGIGMSSSEFELRWRTLDYDRITHQGDTVSPPEDSTATKDRVVYGRNGRGRHAAFHFSSPYIVRMWKDERETTYRVTQGRNSPIEIFLEGERANVTGHGCEIRGITVIEPSISPEEARSVLSTRFLTDPDFKVSVNGVLVTFNDIPNECQQELKVPIKQVGDVRVLVIDSKKADKTTKQHGIAWWVNRRLVGECGWSTSDKDRVLDGRSEEAKRYTFIVFADHLAPAILADWSNFITDSPLWLETQTAVQSAVKSFIHGVTKEKRNKAKSSVRKAHRDQIKKMTTTSQDRWISILDELVDKCPNLSEDHIHQVMSLLANMELSESEYSLLEKMHTLSPDELDSWDTLLESWTLSVAKTALAEIETRLKLIEEIKYKAADTNSDEVHDLQPLFERGLWVFGPQYESREFTSNRGMTTVIKTIFKGTEKGSRNRPDFVITPDSSIGFYSLPSFNDENDEDGIQALVIVELKKAGVPIGSDQKNQVWKYISELKKNGYIKATTKVQGFVLGDSIVPEENDIRREGNNVFIQPMLYSTFTGQAEKRMLNLHKKLSDAPFLQETIERLSINLEQDQQELNLAV